MGTGEALNEHITGQRWPSAAERPQVGTDQDGFFEFYAGPVLPRLRDS